MQTQQRRIIRIETNPFAKVKIKVKMAKNKVDSFGRPLKTKDRNGKLTSTKEIVDAQNIVQFPGTIKYLRPAACKDGLLTGLNYYVPNPYIDEKFYTQDWAKDIFKGHKMVLLQHVLEYKHGVPFNHYTNKLSSRVLSRQEMYDAPFFHTSKAKLPLEGNTFFLDLSNPFNELMYYVAKANSIIANSFEELDGGKNQEALYYIVDEQEAANIKTVKSKRLNEAIAVIEKLEDTAGELVRFAKALGVTEPIANDRQAYESLERYFKLDNFHYENFMFYWKMYNSEINKDQFDAHVELYDAIDAGVIEYRNGVYYWQKPATDIAAAELIRWMSKDKIIGELFINPKSKDELGLIRDLVKEHKKYNI